METPLPWCPTKRNCVCSCDPRPRYRIEPLTTAEDPEKVFRALVDYLQGHPRYQILETTPSTIRAEFTSRVFGFVDDVAFVLTPENVHVRSASRIGFWDLGANRRRVESIRRMLASKSAS